MQITPDEVSNSSDSTSDNTSSDSHFLRLIAVWPDFTLALLVALLLMLRPITRSPTLALSLQNDTDLRCTRLHSSRDVSPGSLNKRHARYENNRTIRKLYFMWKLNVVYIF